MIPMRNVNKVIIRVHSIFLCFYCGNEEGRKSVKSKDTGTALEDDGFCFGNADFLSDWCQLAVFSSNMFTNTTCPAPNRRQIMLDKMSNVAVLWKKMALLVPDVTGEWPDCSERTARWSRWATAAKTKPSATPVS